MAASSANYSASTRTNFHSIFKLRTALHFFVLSDTNECLTANGGCDANAQCTNIPGNRTCICNVGYTGTGWNCTGRSGNFQNWHCCSTEHALLARLAPLVRMQRSCALVCSLVHCCARGPRFKFQNRTGRKVSHSIQSITSDHSRHGGYRLRIVRTVQFTQNVLIVAAGGVGLKT